MSKLWAIVFLFSGWFTSAWGISTPTLLPAFSHELAQYSCQLRGQIASPSRIDDRPICSGTFIQPGVFLTSAHCVTAHLLGYLPRELSFYVTCPGEKTAIVKRMLPKPAYFKTHGQSILNEKMEVDQLELIPDVRSVENDLAIIETEIIPEISNFPSVVMDQKELQDVLSLNRCEVLGYSPARCQPSNLSACIQSFTSPFVDGEANGSLAIVARDETKAFLGGDSGAGVICRNQVGEMKLVGVIESDNTAAPAWQLEQFLKNPVQVKVSPETLFAQQRIEQLKSITNVNFRCSRISSKVCGEVSDLLLKASTQIKMLGIKKIIVENKSLIKISREGSVLRISSSVGAKDLDLLFKF